MDDNSYNHSDSNEMDGISVVLMGVSYPGIIGMTRIEGDNLQEKRSRKEQRMTGSSIMRNWKAGMMQRRWRDSEDQLTRV